MNQKISFLTKSAVVRWIDPLAISAQLKFDRSALSETYRSRGKINGRFINTTRYSGMLVPGAAIRKGSSFESCSHVKALYKRFVLNEPWHKTGYYELYETWYHPITGRSFEYFYFNKLLYWDEIFHEIKMSGYRPSRNPMNNVEIAITSDCKFLFVDGRHRLFFAKALRLPRIPVTINVIAEEAAEKFSKALNATWRPI